jgi:hypothetical protein
MPRFDPGFVRRGDRPVQTDDTYYADGDTKQPSHGRSVMAEHRPQESLTSLHKYPPISRGSGRPALSLHETVPESLFGRTPQTSLNLNTAATAIANRYHR